MQISRHWRLNAQRYRLQGVRFETGEVYPYNRFVPIPKDDPVTQPLKKTVNSLAKAS